MNLFFGLGWFLFLFLLFAILQFNRKTIVAKNFFSEINTWEDTNFEVNGELVCSLLPKEKQERQKQIKEVLVPFLIKKETIPNGIIFYFKDEENLSNQLMEFIALEKTCCPFFKFDLSILPFQQGIALQVSGMPGVKEFIGNLFD